LVSNAGGFAQFQVLNSLPVRVWFPIVIVPLRRYREH
jgi:hypothetical protein